MEYSTLSKEKCSLKEFNILGNLEMNNYSDMLFLTSYGYIIGKPFNSEEEVEKDPAIYSHIILSDVVIVRDTQVTNFNGPIFLLYIDQIIATTPIDRKSFLNQMQHPID
ncbi:hypothetical protein [Acetobacterium sp.]|uniref:hypothetical protein n=1 Tax=Acetobacterium sp. TaxID=1872094 RepID=UPI002F4212D0